MFRIVPLFCAFSFALAPVQADEYVGSDAFQPTSDYTFVVSDAAPAAAADEYWVSNYSLDIEEGAETQALALDAAHDFSAYMAEDVPSEARTQGLRMLWKLMAVAEAQTTPPAVDIQIAEDDYADEATGAIPATPKIAPLSDAPLPNLSLVPVRLRGSIDIADFLSFPI